MVKSIIVSASLATLVLITTGPGATAQDIQYVSATSFASMRDRIDELESRLAGYERAGYAGGERADAYCGGCAGIVSGAEVAFLKAGHSDLKTGGYDYQAAPRVWLGYQRCDGLGARVRWFHYDDSSLTTNNAIGSTKPITQLRFSTFDFELSDSFELGCKWQGTLAGGVRFAKYHETFDDEYDYSPSEYKDPTEFADIDDAIGPVLSVEMRRRVTDRISLIGLLRQAVLMGNHNDDNSRLNDDAVYSTTEIQVGSEYRRTVGDGCAVFFIRSAGEAQFLGGVSSDESENVALVGGNVAFGIAR